MEVLLQLLIAEEGGCVYRECPQHSRAQASSEDPPAVRVVEILGHAPVGDLPLAVHGFFHRSDLQIRLDDVHRVDHRPGNRTSDSTGHEDRPRGVSLSALHLPEEFFHRAIGKEIPANRWTFSEDGGSESFVEASKALGAMNVLYAIPCLHESILPLRGKCCTFCLHSTLDNIRWDQKKTLKNPTTAAS